MRHLDPILRRSCPLLLGVWVLAAGCQAFGPSDKASVADLIHATRYQEALVLASERAQDDPDDAEVQADLDRAEAAWLIDRGRDLVFAGAHTEALAHFQAARERLPDSPATLNWLRKAEGELANDHRGMAFDAEGAGDFELAAEHYTRALYYTPGDPVATAGLDRVRSVASYRAGQAEEYYRKGVRTLRRLKIPEALHNFQANQKFAPSDEVGAQRRTEVEALMGEDRRRIGAELESRGLYRGALLEYRLAAEYGGDSEMLDADIARMEREIGALDLLADAERAVLAGDPDRAFELLDEADQATELLTGEVTAARTKIEAENLELLYQRALELEEDFEYPQAIAAFDELLAQAGGFYLDAISRRDTLSDHVADAERLYAEARQAGDADQRVRLLRQIQLIWPTYRDVAEELARLES